MVEEARRWTDCPLRHHGRTFGIGVDCIGLVQMVGVLTGAMPDPGEGATAWMHYGRLPNPKKLLAALDAFLVRVDGAWQDGDIGAFAYGDRGDGPRHVAIMASFGGRASMIHANPHLRTPRVRENTYAAGWPERARGFWRYPGLV